MIPSDDDAPREIGERDSNETDPSGALPAQRAPGELPPSVAVHRGILHCRRGEWHSGLHYLLEAEGPSADVTLPGLYYSYLGHAKARCERRHDEALELCERAVAIQFYEPENFLNLAWARLLARDRRGAAEALARGLELDPRQPGLLGLQQRIGLRRPAVLRFLPREHRLNRLLGRLRHRWLMRLASA